MKCEVLSGERQVEDSRSGHRAMHLGRPRVDVNRLRVGRIGRRRRTLLNDFFDERLGFAHVSEIAGGMTAWETAKLPVLS